MKLRTIVLAFAVVALATAALAADTKSPMKPGKWQVTMSTDIPGMPIKMPSVTVTTCVTKEQAENPQPPKNKRDSECNYTDYKFDGNTVSWKVKCTGKQPMTGEGQMTFSGDTYEGVNHLKTDTVEMTSKFNGKYVGECDK